MDNPDGSNLGPLPRLVQSTLAKLAWLQVFAFPGELFLMFAYGSAELIGWMAFAWWLSVLFLASINDRVTLCAGWLFVKLSMGRAARLIAIVATLLVLLLLGFPIKNASTRIVYSTGRFGEPPNNRYVRPFVADDGRLVIEFGVTTTELRGVDIGVQFNDECVAEGNWCLGTPGLYPCDNKVHIATYGGDGQSGVDQLYRIHTQDIPIRADLSLFVVFEKCQGGAVKGCKFWEFGEVNGPENCSKMLDLTSFNP